ncbi:MAG: tRNA 2-thiouridine(34) synthase MnmA [Candidatus Moraniibacteriota bacterium]
MSSRRNCKKILVGFSGGVDSTAAIYFLKKAGYQPVAFHLKLFKEGNEKFARKIASKLGVEFIIEDISDVFKNKVIDYFIKEYSSNKTPNPCVKCNPEVKFHYLFKKADCLGIEKVATGHYAKIEKEDDCYNLKKGGDKSKDQSYFLYRLSQKELSRTIFPLAEKRKKDLKELLERQRISFAKEESQDLCFFGKKEKLEDFIDSFSVKSRPGEIVNEKGDVLGRHKGLIYYTKGQRKGLLIGGSGPYYVIGKDIENNCLLVSNNVKHPFLLNKEIIVSDCNWICEEPQEGKKYQFKSRYQVDYSEGRIKKLSENKWKASLDVFQYAVSEGQSLVVYDGAIVVGGGVIE